MWPALVLSSAAFALWHVTVNLLTLGRPTSPAPAWPLSLWPCWGLLLGVFVAGLVFGASPYTRGLGAPWLAHWLVDALMLLALAATGVSGGRGGRAQRPGQECGAVVPLAA